MGRRNCQSRGRPNRNSLEGTVKLKNQRRRRNNDCSGRILRKAQKFVNLNRNKAAPLTVEVKKILESRRNLGAFVCESPLQHKVVVRRNLLKECSRVVKVGDILQVTLSNIPTRSDSHIVALTASLFEPKAERSSDEKADLFSLMTKCMRETEPCADDMFEIVSQLEQVNLWTSLLSHTEQSNAAFLLDGFTVANFVASHKFLPMFAAKRKFFRIMLQPQLYRSCQFYLSKLDARTRSRVFAEAKTFYAHAVSIKCQGSEVLLPILKSVCTDPGDLLLIECLKKLSVKCSKRSTQFQMLDWNELPNTPLVEEISGKINGDLRKLMPVKIGEPYSSVEHYLDTYLRLLREDCQFSLKSTIQETRGADVRGTNLKVFPNINFKGVALDIGVYLQMSLNVKDLRRSKSNQNLKVYDLQKGNLIFVSVSGNFCLDQPQDTFWATVYSRESEKKNGVVEFCLELSFDISGELSIGSLVKQLHFSSGNICLVESPTYFRAFDPVLNNLKSMTTDNLAFVNQLVYLKSKPKTPNYLTEVSDMNYDLIFPHLNSQKFLSNLRNTSLEPREIQDSTYSSLRTEANCISKLLSELDGKAESFLDDSQRSALKLMFENELAIVQGPPGCGKTYLGTKFVELLMSMEPRPFNGPVLLITYKNHALDEFLLKILNFLEPSEVCRVGGRSREPQLDKVSLRAKRMDAEKSNNSSNHLYKNLRQTEERLFNSLRSRFESFNIAIDQFILEFLSNDVLWTFLNSQKFLVPIPERQFDKEKKRILELKTTRLLGEVTKKNMVTLAERALRKQNNAGDLLSLINTPKCDESRDFLQVLKLAIKHWAPTAKYVSQAESKFVVKKSLADKARTPCNSDEQDAKEEERSEFLVESATDKPPKKMRNVFAMANETDEFVFKMSPFAPQITQEIDFKTCLLKGDIWNLSEREKLAVIQGALLSKFQERERKLMSQDDSEDDFQQYLELCQEKSEFEQIESSKIIGNCKIVGMTITGASINRCLIDFLRPSVVIVEEAGEVLEPQLTAFLKSFVKHLILIGDHKQLRPSVENYELVKKYHFDVSMMERLIKGNIPFASLGCQNRMRPEISQYLLDIYPGLKNGPRVDQIEPVRFFEENMIFWTHSSPEEGQRSYMNKEEAKRCAGLAKFLTGQRIKPSSITILAGYRAQKSLIKKEVALGNKKEMVVEEESAKEEEENEIKVQTIDMYQGDENDIVIVSLTRSNSNKKIGFMKQLNRRCVAQSRARKLTVFIGNSELFQHFHSWHPFIKRLQQNHAINSELRIKCPTLKHKDDAGVHVADSSQFPKSPEFCVHDCEFRFPCGHFCPKKCQPSHAHSECRKELEYYEKEKCEHKRTRPCYEKTRDVKCVRRCEFKFPLCNHECPDMCCHVKPHGFCQKPVTDTCPECSKKVQRSCSVKITLVVCKNFVNQICTKCCIMGKRVCSLPESDYKCEEDCSKQLSCGHSCQWKCWQTCEDFQKECKYCLELEAAEKEQQQQALREIRKRRADDFSKLLKEAKKAKRAAFEVKQLTETNDVFNEYGKICTIVEDKYREFCLKSSECLFVEKIEKVTNGDLLSKFYQSTVELIDSPDNELMFTVKNRNQADEILKNGLEFPDIPGKYGLGIYFSNSFSITDSKFRRETNFILVGCEIAFGRRKTTNEPWDDLTGDELQKEGFDSLYVPAKVFGPEDLFVSFHPNRILPKYIVHCRKESQLKMIPRDLTTGPVYHKVELTHGREIDNEKTKHYLFVYGHFNKLLEECSNFHNKRLKAVFYHSSQKLENKFKKEEKSMKQRYGDCAYASPIFAFHGTDSEEKIENIVRNNFDMTRIKRHVYGWGIYLSELPDVSIGYAGNLDKLLLCKVLPGKSHEGDCKQSTVDTQCECDSHRVNKDANGRGWAIVMSNTDRILPCYELHLETKRNCRNKSK